MGDLRVVDSQNAATRSNTPPTASKAIVAGELPCESSIY